MIRILSDASKDIFTLARTGSQQEQRLNWTSQGLELFLVLSSSTAEKVDLTGTEKAKITALLSEHLGSMPDNTEKKVNGITMRLLTFIQQRRDGGIILNGDPGYYAVYGITRSGNQGFDIYVNESSARSYLVKVMRDIEITEAPFMVEEGWLRIRRRRRTVYSGYHRITVKGQNKGLSGGVLRYSVGAYTYPFPDQVVTDGGSFFVKMDEQAVLTVSGDNEGLNIILRKRV